MAAAVPGTKLQKKERADRQEERRKTRKEAMGFHLTGMTLKNLFSKPATTRYPFEPRTFYERTRGHVENDIEACILCGICMKTCPATALVVNRAERTWTINPFSCVQCMACVRACPPKSLSMHKESTPVGPAMTTRTLTKPPDEKDNKKRGRKAEKNPAE